MAPKRSDERSLTVVVVDVSPVVWGHREMRRRLSDKARAEAGKLSAGPTTLDELLSAVLVFSSAFASLERDSALLLVAVAESEVAVVYPRKDHLEAYFSNPENKLDSRRVQRDFLEGVAELVTAAAARLSAGPAATLPPATTLAAMASGFSIALCLINRFLVAVNAGVSALHDHSWSRGGIDDGGTIAALGGGGDKKHANVRARAWSPRVLLIQATDDRPSDYNAFMNCAFAAVKQNIVVDGCFLRGPGDNDKSSPYLEQTCDLTGGVTLSPTGANQSNMALTQLLLTVFLPPRSSRPKMNLPAINKVDFRARAFDTGKTVDMAFVCNQCLSIFSEKPSGRCPTCGAEIKTQKRQRP